MTEYKINNLFVDSIRRTITDGEGITKKLSQSEIYLLNYLIKHQGKAVLKDELMSAGWPNKVVVINSLTVAIGNLRRVLNDPNIIGSNKGVGYTLSGDAKIEPHILSEKKPDLLSSPATALQSLDNDSSSNHNDSNNCDSNNNASNSNNNASNSNNESSKNKSKSNNKQNIVLYNSIIIFLVTGAFAIQWLLSYVGG